MPGLNTDDIIRAGLFLKAKQAVPKLNAVLANIGTFAPGAYIGQVDSYIVRNGVIYWQLLDNGKPFYVKHGVGVFEVGDQVENILAQKAKKAEQDRINEIGAVRYYIEKYLPQIIIAGVVVAIIKIYANKK